MLNVFTLANGRLFQEEIDSLDGLTSARPVWVDLEDPSPEEKSWIAVKFGLVIPADIIDDDLEESARFYEEDGAIHIRSDFLIDDDEAPRNVRVASSCMRTCCFRCTGKTCPCSACCACAPAASPR